MRSNRASMSRYIARAAATPAASAVAVCKKAAPRTTNCYRHSRRRKEHPVRLTSIVGFGVLLLVGRVVASPPPGYRLLSDADITRIIRERIDVQHQGVGIVVGVIDAQGRRIIAHGNLDSAPGAPPVAGDTVFEIGSATKVFTSLLLADAVQRGEVALTDPVARYLPPDVKVPERNGRQITLEDLATHTSGLPRLPSNLAPKDATNPYADYSVPQLYGFLSSHQLARDIGSKYEYSNLGAGLLGHVLARRAGVDYETLVRTRVLEPLGMTSTAVTLPDALKRRLAIGHNGQRVRVPNWDLPTLAGAGALRSTADDLLTFLAANLGYTRSPLSPAMAAMLAARRPTGTPGLEIALGWHILASPAGGEIVWHNGGTGGYRSFIAFNPKERTGVVALSNVSTPTGADDIGRHVLDQSFPLSAPPVVRKEIAVSPEVLERYVGKYDLAPNVVIAITREDARLFVQLTGQPKFELFASAEREFFLKVVDAQITFEMDADGRATRLILHQNGMHQPAKRVGG
jgi:serine-type D-Ala-D-Ala carboxypeptidase/endopeptidase